MVERNPTNVADAFQMLLEELEREIAGVNQAGAQAFAAGAYDRLDAIKARAQHIEAFRVKAVALRDEWARPRPLRSKNRRDAVKKGEGTPQTDFERPVLEALVELGGSGRMSDVLRIVERRMRDHLTAKDFEGLSATPSKPRWRNRAEWARNTMREDGRVKSGSRLGIWEISDQGRAWLARGE